MLGEQVEQSEPPSSTFFAMESQVQELFQDRLNIEGLLKHRLYKASFEKLTACIFERKICGLELWKALLNCTGLCGKHSTYT
jgi:hypothetical protein